MVHEGVHMGTGWRGESKRGIVKSGEGSSVWLLSMAVQLALPTTFQNSVCGVSVLEVGAEQVGSGPCLGLGRERPKISKRRGIFFCVSKRA